MWGLQGFLRKKDLADFTLQGLFSIVVLQSGFALNHKHTFYFSALIAACAAARRAIGTRNGEQET